MSMIYDNIKAVCKHYGIKIRDIESPATTGFISRYEAREKINDLPIWVFDKLSLESGVPIEDILRKDLAVEIELAEIRENIERLKKRESELTGAKMQEGGVDGALH